MRSLCLLLPTVLSLIAGCTPLAPDSAKGLDVDSARGLDDTGGGAGDTADTADTADTGESEDTGDVGTAPTTLAELFALLGPAPSSFTIEDPSLGAEIEGDSVVINLGPDAFFFSDGSLASGPVDVSLIEYDSLGDMVRGGRGTLTTDGEWLATSGSFALEASQEGQPLVIDGIADMAFDAWDGTTSGMELWAAGKPGDDPSRCEAAREPADRPLADVSRR